MAAAATGAGTGAGRRRGGRRAWRPARCPGRPGRGLTAIGISAAAWWRGASASQRNAVTGGAVALVVVAIVLYALALSPDRAPVAAQPSQPAASRTAAAPVTSSPPVTPASVTPAGTPSVPPAAVIIPTEPNPAPAAPAAQLGVSLTVTAPAPGSSYLGVSFSITNNGRAATRSLTARLSLPGGVGLVRSGQVGSWNCAMLGSSIACSRGPLPARAVTSDFFTLEIQSPSACGRFIGLTVSSAAGGGSASAAIRCGTVTGTGAQGPATLSAQHELISAGPAITLVSTSQAAAGHAAFRRPGGPGRWRHGWWLRGWWLRGWRWPAF